MFKRMLGMFTSVVAGLAVVGVAWASGDDSSSGVVNATAETAASISTGVSTPTTDVTVPDSSTEAKVESSTHAHANVSGATTDASASTWTNAEGKTSTSAATPSTTATTVDSSTSTSVDDSDNRQVPDGVSTHILPSVGTVTIEVESSQLILVDVSAPGWTIERQRVEPDRIELELIGALDAKAEFEARVRNGRVDVEVEVDLD